jgi:hypothetical protein
MFTAYFNIYLKETTKKLKRFRSKYRLKMATHVYYKICHANLAKIPSGGKAQHLGIGLL